MDVLVPRIIEDTGARAESCCGADRGVPVPQIWEPIVERVQLVPQERVQIRTREPFLDVPVPHNKEEIVDAARFYHRNAC